MESKLKILILEDSPRDVEIVRNLLQNAGIASQMDLAKGKPEFEKFLTTNTYDIILSDFNLPGYDGNKALELRNQLCPDVPFICISGTIGEEIAINLLKQGANDYILKDRLEKLPSAVERAIEEAKEKVALKQMHEKLDHASENWSKTFDAIQDGIFLLDADQRIIEANQAFLDIADKTREEIIGQHCWPHVHHTNCPIDNCPFVKAQTSKKREITELKLGESEYEVLIDPIIDENNNLTGAVHIIADITERKKAEEALHKSNEKFTSYIEHSPLGIFIVDDKGFYRDCNPSAFDMVGYTREELLQLSISDLVVAEEMEKGLQSFQNLAEDGFIKFEVNLLRKDKTTVPVILEAVQLPGNNMFIAFCTDITERKKAEAKLIESELRYRTLYKNSPSGILVLDEKGIILEANDEIAKTSLYSPDELVGTDVRRLTSLDERYLVSENIQRILAGEVLEHEFVSQRKDGTFYNINLKEIAIALPNGQRGVLSVSNDITVRKQTEEAMKKSESSLRFAQKIAKMGSWEWDVVTQKTTWSENYYAFFGLNPLEVEPSFELFRSKIHPDDVAFLDENYGIVFNEQKPVNFEHRVILAEGTIKWIQNYVVPIIADGKLIKMKGAFIDITDLKQAERITHDIIEKNPMSIQIVDKDGFTLKVNPAHTRLFGAVPPPDFSVFTNSQLRQQDMIESFGRLRKGEVVNFPDSCFNAHDLNPSFPETDIWVRAVAFPLHESQQKPDQFAIMHENITEYKKYELALKESEEKYRNIFDNVQDVFFQTDLNGIVHEISPSINYFTDFNRDKIIGNPVQNIYYNSDDREILLIELQKNGELKDYELLLKTNNGEGKYVSINARLVMDAQGNPHHIDGALRDISERKQAENVIRESEQRFRKVFEESQIGMIISRVDLRFEKVNPAFCKMLGYTSDELTSMSYVQITHPDDVGGDIENIKKLEHGEIPFYKVEKRYLTKAGDIIWGNIVVTSVRDNDGKLLYYLGLIEDITERRLAEAKLQASKDYLERIINTVAYPIFVKDEEHKYYLVNTALCEMFGYTKEEIIGKSDYDFISVEQADQFLIKDDEVYDLGKESKKEEEITDSTGNVKTLITTKTLYTDKDGKKFLVAIINDISERKQMELDLIKAKDKAEESDRLKSAFLANMSHEIRTPMNGILGFAELLKEPKLSGDKQQEFIGIIEHSGIRLLNIINNLVNISKIESGLMNVYVSEANINDQIESIYKFFKPEMDKKGVEFTFITGLLPKDAIVKSDHEKISAILTNLVGNAIKFTPKGSIEFGYNKKEDLEFYVKDTGIGIRSEQLAYIFERFRQGSESLSRNYEGSGLGLSISKSYVEMLGGKIWVESEIGKGSTFYFTIPYNVQPKEKVIKSKNELPEENDLQKNNLKILIAEDDEISLLLLTSGVELFAKEILVARTGNDAVEICRNNTDIDLILMDIKMPGIDGYEAIRQIRQFNNNVIIIAQTAFGLIGDREKALAAGCNGYISKPIILHKLEELIDSHFPK